MNVDDTLIGHNYITLLLIAVRDMVSIYRHLYQEYVGMEVRFGVMQSLDVITEKLL